MKSIKPKTIQLVVEVSRAATTLPVRAVRDALRASADFYGSPVKVRILRAAASKEAGR